MFTDKSTRAPAAARTPELCPSSPAIRAIRSRTRRRLHEPRPASTPESRARVGQWKAEVKAACLAGHISKGGDKYLHELLAIPSVARGDYSLYCDAENGQRLNVSGRTVRRHRKEAADHGLIEVLGHGKDRKPCAVRPILRDGTPVFPGPELAGKSDTFGRLTRPILAANLLLTETLKTEDPPLPPVPEASEEGERAFDQFEDKPAIVEPPSRSPQNEPAEPVAAPATPGLALASPTNAGRTGAAP
jgi:hypothetical protein